MDIKHFVRKNLSVDRWNTQFGFQVVLMLILAASWAGSTIHARASSPNEDTIYVRYALQDLRRMEREFYKNNLLFIRKLRHDRRRKLFLVVDETYEPYYGKEENEWIHEYKPEDGSRGSFKFLTFALVAPKQWRFVVRSVPIRKKQNTTTLIVRTSLAIYRETPYLAALFDRGFYEKNLAFALQNARIPFLIRAEIRGWMNKKLSFIFTSKRFLHWYKDGYEPLHLWLGWKKHGKKKLDWGFVTNIPTLSWIQCLAWYKERWNIENVFKATDGIQLRMATSKIDARLFSVLLSFLVYNSWQQKKHETGTHVPLSNYLEKLINDELEEFKDIGPPLNMHIPGWSVFHRRTSSCQCLFARSDFFPTFHFFDDFYRSDGIMVSR